MRRFWIVEVEISFQVSGDGSLEFRPNLVQRAESGLEVRKMNERKQEGKEDAPADKRKKGAEHPGAHLLFMNEVEGRAPFPFHEPKLQEEEEENSLLVGERRERFLFLKLN